MNQSNVFFISFKYTGRLQKQHSHDDRSHIPDHKGIHFFALKGMSAGFHFLTDHVGLMIQPTKMQVRREMNGMRKLLLI